MGWLVPLGQQLVRSVQVLAKGKASRDQSCQSLTLLQAYSFDPRNGTTGTQAGLVMGGKLIHSFRAIGPHLTSSRPISIVGRAV
jgi:hypothetical protein